MIYNGIFEQIKHDDGVFTELNIYAGEEKLDLRHDLMNHSQQFSVGFLGSGPSQASLSILAHAMGEEFGLKHYMRFKCDVIAGLKQDEDFALRFKDIVRWAEKIASEEKSYETR
jgi:hypothetical protein